MTSFTIKTPGKLMVAGEFAVLEPDYQLVVMAVDRFVYTKVVDSDQNVVHLKDFGLKGLKWKFKEGEAIFDSIDSRLSFVKDAISIAASYLEEKNVSMEPFSLTVESELDDSESGLKYGLGSSAAVVTSLIAAILTKCLPQPPKKELIFKLAAISHVKTQGNGSGADIAASTYGGVLNYASFQAEWLLEALQSERSMARLAEKDWPHLAIRQVAFPRDVQVCIGWTGTPASTGSLVGQIKSLKHSNPDKYHSFLKRSEQAVAFILNGMKSDDASLFYDGISQNRSALAQLGKDANVEIETEKLHRLSVAADRYGGAGKLSGAGGGDCGIAFIPRDFRCKELHRIWSDAGIKPLSIDLCKEGTQLVDSE